MNQSWLLKIWSEVGLRWRNCYSSIILALQGLCLGLCLNSTDRNAFYTFGVLEFWSFRLSEFWSRLGSWVISLNLDWVFLECSWSLRFGVKLTTTAHWTLDIGHWTIQCTTSLEFENLAPRHALNASPAKQRLHSRGWRCNWCTWKKWLRKWWCKSNYQPWPRWYLQR